MARMIEFIWWLPVIAVLGCFVIAWIVATILTKDLQGD